MISASSASLKGSGKTTIADIAVRKLRRKIHEEEELSTTITNSSPRSRILALDLDVCVPEWMKDNFAMGIYPNLEQRREFAHSACDYIDNQLLTATHQNDERYDKQLKFPERVQDKEQQQQQQQQQQPREKTNNDRSNITSSSRYCIVSFSFVNDDLREIYRSRFPSAKWVLVDTNEEEAQRRVDAREGHFYKGKKKTKEEHNSTPRDDGGGGGGGDDIITRAADVDDVNNSEWNFQPVTFRHIVLDGNSPAEVNADKVVQIIVGEAKA